MNFVIRDDDLNYFSSPHDVEKWYNDIFAKNIPVGFSVVAFVKPASDVYTKEKKDGLEEYPISEHKDLIEYIKGNSLIEVIQHGCTHETKNKRTKKQVFEYAKKSGLVEDTKRAKEELEKAFGKEIKVFAAPHDRISNHGLKSLEEAGLHIIKGKGCKNFIFSFRGIKNYIKMIIHKLLYPNSFSSPAFPYVLNYGKHKQAYSTRLRRDNLKELMDNLEYINKKDGNFIITAHMHSFSEKEKENLLELIKKAKSLNANFIFPSSLFKHI